MKVARCVTTSGDPTPFYAALEDGRLRRLDVNSITGLMGSEVLVSGESYALADVALLVPSEPTKVICVGLNYRHHAEEMNKAIPPEPLLFMKPTTALLPPGGSVELPPSSSLVHHEGELAIVIGKRAKNVPEAEALSHVVGYTCANDVTARDIQRREKRYTRGKGFDTFAPLGPWLVTGVDPDALDIELRVNGEVRQKSTTSDMIFSCAKIVSFVSSIMTLLPGDVILTGTPSGVNQLQHGDAVDVEISGIGTLSHGVVDPTRG